MNGTALTASARAAFSLANKTIQDRGLRYIFKRGVQSLGQLDLRRQFRLARLLAVAHNRPVTQRHPKSVIKYLTPCLAGSFSSATRLSILLHHHEQLSKLFRHDFLRRAYEHSFELWRVERQGKIVSIALTLPTSDCYEGDLCLRIFVDENWIYQLTFTIARGADLSTGFSQALLVSSLQGVRGQMSNIHLATKSCLDIAPADLLLRATEAFALSLDIPAIVGVSDARQLMRSFGNVDGISFSYDKFWDAHGGTRNANDLFELPVPCASRPLTELPSGHRTRTRRKRDFKSQLIQDIQATLALQKR